MKENKILIYSKNIKVNYKNNLIKENFYDFKVILVILKTQINPTLNKYRLKNSNNNKIKK